jgi:phosphatidylglycerophosphate synthase
MGTTRVQFAPISFAIAGALAATLLGLALLHSPRPSAGAVGWTAAIGYFAVSTVLLLRGLRRSPAARFGPANLITTLRSTLVGVIAGIVAASFVEPMPTALLVSLVVPALLLDAVDGWAARRTNSASELGARFDMEVDAFLLLVLSAYVAQSLGTWVLAIGLMRYAFVAAGFVFPWLRRQLPFRYWRKVVTAAQGIALTVAVTRFLPLLDVILVAVALALLVESFGRDVIWLAIRRREPAPADAESARPRGAKHDR